jgi:hypothetical protein
LAETGDIWNSQTTVAKQVTDMRTITTIAIAGTRNSLGIASKAT